MKRTESGFAVEVASMRMVETVSRSLFIEDLSSINCWAAEKVFFGILALVKRWPSEMGREINIYWAIWIAIQLQCPYVWIDIIVAVAII